MLLIMETARELCSRLNKDSCPIHDGHKCEKCPLYLEANPDSYKEPEQVKSMKAPINAEEDRIALEEYKIIDERHYCVKCKAKRRQRFMEIVSKRLHRTQWQCLTCKK